MKNKKISWNTGLTKKTDGRLACAARNISLALKGRQFTPEWKEKIRLWHLGKKASEITKRKMSLAHKGKPKPLGFAKRISIITKQRLAINKEKYLIGKNNPNWKGGRRRNKGYIYIYAPNHIKADCLGYVPETILIWEKFWNRPFPENHIIHHIDGNPQNNDISNLMLITQAEHAKIHAKNRQRKSTGQFISNDLHT